jgi:uncharacterized protein (TIGR02147 family)
MLKESVFEFLSYIPYLRSRAGGEGTRSGVKSAMAKSLGCQPTYVSQVMHGKAHLSLEQGEVLNEFFSHSKEEAFFFLLLIQKDRSGTKRLKDFFQEQIDEVLQKRLVLTKRLGSKETLSEVHQSTYYSSWIFAAVHIALTIPELRTREALANHFNLPLRKITEALTFLQSAGLVKASGGEFEVTTAQIRLGNDSKNILKHHTNWRLQAAESLDREQITDLHYSGVVSLSAADVLKVKNMLLETVKESQDLIKDSKEEELFAISMDFFSLKK